MRRPQFTLKTLLRLMAVVGILCASGHYLKPAGKTRRRTGNHFATTYYWHNGVALTICRDEVSDYPSVSIDWGASE